MAQTSVITIGLARIAVGVAAPNGTMPAELTKIGKVYKDTCKIAQDAAEVTEHFEEGKSAPEVRKKTKKVPKVTFSLMDCDPDALVKYIGGEKVNTTGWGFNGDEITSNIAIKIESEQVLTSASRTLMLKQSSTPTCPPRAFSLLTSRLHLVRLHRERQFRQFLRNNRGGENLYKRTKAPNHILMVWGF